MTPAEIRAHAHRIAASTNYEAAPNTPTKQLARLIEALADHVEQQPVTTLATINAAMADMDRPHWSASQDHPAA